MNLLHRITHKAVTLERDNVGTIFFCYPRFFGKDTFVEITSPDGTKCNAKIDNRNFVQFMNDMLSTEVWTTDFIHELIHKYGKKERQ